MQYFSHLYTLYAELASNLFFVIKKSLHSIKLEKSGIDSIK